MNPYLEKTEYVDVQLTAISSIEKIMSDPTYSLLSRNHILSYDKMVDFVSNEDTSRYPFCPLETSTNSYISLLRKLGLLDYSNNKPVYDIQILISSTHTEVNTIGIMTSKDISDLNYSLPTGSSPSDSYPPHFNTETVYLGIRSYEFLIIDIDQNGEYDRLFIDINMNKNFQDEVTNEIYGRDEDNNPKLGFVKGDTFILDSRTYIVTDIFKSGQGAQILNIDAADIVLGRDRSYSDIVLVISRLVMVEEFGNLTEKRLTLIMWEGNRIC
ncbi:MAG: hypothetical protein APG12_00302 [Candidatus Methanofastidiosum methylothiophilum]|uniref:Uncharacterized protein n=1 Tax=Candidatus Methanofastidiosum methylothiophilum TaxID=1705564 RepID=A0A150IM57_9EURY|nr:MAG: hypothetical protein APG10_00336 [Candidatus Methanofastidiosum methylthiophilus]KYC48619.1 MAG: hypothetical protein APG11_00129 [Candidatus Methanofastidiosum methylthiophilus]KYC51176.1 MAG: hypothetical protein APG12_00302 [Candidatus Methanofastidiosum methylthiophilus]